MKMILYDFIIFVFWVLVKALEMDYSYILPGVRISLSIDF